MLHDQDLLSIQETRSKVQLAWEAAAKLRAFSQEQIDAIVERMAAAGREHAQKLADMAVEETGYGNARDKYAKNMLAADVLARALRGMKTVGVLREVPEDKVVEIGVPVGVIAAILPTTNPTSTAIYKILISIKSGNTIVLSPHPRARNCTCATADLLYRTALEAGAPENVIQCVSNPTIESTNALMRHERTGVILSTGGHGIVKAAYSSGKPAFGVGPGNVPVLIEQSADVAESVASVVSGKSFDYGTVCSSEQAIVITADKRDAVIAALKANQAYVCDEKQGAALAKLLLLPPNFTVNPKCVGQSPLKIAQMAGFEVPADTSILAVEIGGVGKQHPLSAEKLSPVLALIFVPDHEAAVQSCEAILRFGGLGHTCVIYSKNDARIREYGMRMPAFRVLVNTPSPQGSVGITTGVFPAMTLGCGAIAGNITSDNIGPRHLINIKRLAYRVERAAPAPHPAPAPVTSPVKSSVSAAVEKYLAQRGFTGSNPQPSSSTVEAVVDRFLAARSAPPAPQPAASCAIPAAPPAPAANPAPPAPAIHVVDFVCESDVRAAVAAKRKIYIGPKTIVTPSARELSGQHDILVEAER